MRNLSELLANRPIDPRMTVTMQIRPNGRIGIQITPSMLIFELGALPTHDHDGLFFAPVLHLSEWMPYMLMIFLGYWMI
jgi:hypothetical protein